MSATTFFYPVVKEPTGRVQYALNRSEVVTIERIGEVHRGQVITIGPPNKPPTPKALDFARGLVASGNFAHVADDTPLGVPVLSTEEAQPDGPDVGDKTGDFESPRGDETPMRASFDFDSDPATATLTDTTEE